MTSFSWTTEKIDSFCAQMTYVHMQSKPLASLKFPFRVLLQLTSYIDDIECLDELETQKLLSLIKEFRASNLLRARRTARPNMVCSF